MLVTHDPKVAAYAHRTIHVVDGMIESDENNPARRPDPAPAEEENVMNISQPGRLNPGPEPGRRSTARTAEKNLSSPLGLERLSQFMAIQRPGRDDRAPALLPATWLTAPG